MNEKKEAEIGEDEADELHNALFTMIEQARLNALTKES
jgi:hemerythrin